MDFKATQVSAVRIHAADEQIATGLAFFAFQKPANRCDWKIATESVGRVVFEMRDKLAGESAYPVPRPLWSGPGHFSTPLTIEI